MPKIHKRNLTRSLAAGLAACVIVPGAAMAMPASGTAGVTAQDYQSLDYRAPHQTGSRGDGAAKQDRLSDQTGGRGRGLPVAPAAPQWPVNPQPIARPHSVAAAKPSTDGGVDSGVWIGLGAAALAGGIGFAGAKRVRIGRQRQPA
jgi:hypothetical protein